MALQSAFAKLSPGTAVRRKVTTATLTPGTAVRRPSAAPLLAPAAAAAPAATAASDTAPPPLNPSYGADINAADRNLSTTLTSNLAARGQLGSTYGFGVDTAGNVMDDHSNPFSRAAALQTAYDTSVRGTTNSLAAQGQLYSGAMQNAQNYNARNNLQRRDALIREFTGARSRLDAGDQAAKDAYQSAVESAAAANAQWALEHPNLPPPAAAATAPSAVQRAAVAPSATQKTLALRRSWNISRY